jgi:hypothetical protein
MARDTRSNKEYSARTIETARWAREQIKRQSGRSSKCLEFQVWSFPLKTSIDFANLLGHD